jgi:parallel beta-helix repeat protein
VITKGGLGIGFGNDQGTSTIVGNIVSGVHGNGLDVSSGASLTIQGNTVENNAGVGISSGGKGKLTIQNNVISNNTDYGILSQGTGTMLIQNNTISRNGGGINLNSYSAIKYNNIQNNTQNSVYLSTASNIDATYNWWGTTDVQAINQTIYDFKDDFTVGTVNFVPFLTLPNPESIPNLNTTPIASGSPTPAVPEYPTWIILPLFVIALLLSSLFIRKKNNQKIAHHAFWS